MKVKVNIIEHINGTPHLKDVKVLPDMRAAKKYIMRYNAVGSYRAELADDHHTG